MALVACPLGNPSGRIGCVTLSLVAPGVCCFCFAENLCCQEYRVHRCMSITFNVVLYARRAILRWSRWTFNIYG